MPQASVLLAFMAATLALNFTPGADMAYVVARSLGQGRRAGVLSALAITVGCFVHIGLATLGLAALLAHSPLAFRILQYAGAGYLLFIAWRLLRDGVRSNEAPVARAGYRRIFIQGVLTNVLNPKVALFILAFLPQFVDPARGSPAAQMLVLGALFCLSGTIVNGSIALLTARAGRVVAGSSATALWLRRVSAGILALLAVRLALAARALD
jgi:threonine/homoserine/homoserine lactone efflux protein